ncbi:MAG: hypothetical protein K0R38_6967, partial [Polyangiaceae bacterium]|nr:hypothetical protein [Polyangiaceae bacterium]
MSALVVAVGVCLPRPGLAAFDVSDTSWEGTSELFE